MRFLLFCFWILVHSSSEAQMRGFSEACVHEYLRTNAHQYRVPYNHFDYGDSLSKGTNFFEYLLLREEEQPGFLKHFYPRIFYRNKAMSYLEDRNTLSFIISRPPAPKIKIKVKRNRSDMIDELSSIQINGTEFINQMNRQFFDEIALESCCEGYLKASEAYFVEQEDGDYIYLYLFGPNLYLPASISHILQVSSEDEEFWELPGRGNVCGHNYYAIHKIIFSYNSQTNQANYVSQFHVGAMFIKRFGLYITVPEHSFQF